MPHDDLHPSTTLSYMSYSREQEVPMLSVRLTADQEAMLDRLARETGRSKSYYVKRALDDFLADRADYFLAIAAIERNELRYSADEVRRELGL